MAEDVTRNLSYTDDIDEISKKVADHLNRFWDPRMKAAIVEYAAGADSVLSETLRLAVTRLN
jgi:hypothetical protein